MSYTLSDHHYDCEHKGGFCETCADDSAELAVQNERLHWLKALAGNWTCLGCGAEIGHLFKMTCSDGCYRCKPLFELIANAVKRTPAWAFR